MLLVGAVSIRGGEITKRKKRGYKKTFFEKREERLRSKEGIHEDSVDIEEV